MSKLQKLIAELCPNGVESILLGDLCRIRTGKLNANAQVKNGKYPFFTCDATPYRIDTYAFDTNAILISGNGSQVGHLNKYNGKFNAYQRTYVLDDFKNVQIDYLYHYLSGKLKPYILINSKKGSVPYIILPMLTNFLVPVPPLEVQAEIVRILDTFTELTAELTVELTARQQQYEYYRDSLLNFNHKIRGVQWVKLKDICNIKRGIRVVKSQLDNTFKYPVYQNSLTPLGNYSKYNQTANTTFVIVAGAAGQVGYSKVNFWAADDCFVFECSDLANSRYLYYQLIKQQNYLLSRVRKASVPRLSRNVLDNLSIPIPSIEEQNRIVSILDRFDSLCNDMKTGLPAEISARKQQYEYYRDKLLTFERKN